MRLLGLSTLVILWCCSQHSDAPTGGSGGSADGSNASLKKPHEDMAVISAGTYAAVDPVYAPDSSGACSAGTVAKVEALAKQIPWPDRSQEVSAFAIDRRRVTCSDYQSCASSGACTRDTSAASCTDEAAEVTSDEAVAFCRWRHARLPTLLEWQAAVRGTSGQSSANCDDPNEATGCTFTNRFGVVVDLSASSAEFTDTKGCWHGDSASVQPLEAAPRKAQLYMFVPASPRAGSGPRRAEFRCARDASESAKP